MATRTEKGPVVSYDGGKFRLIVTNITITNNEIKFTPYIDVTQGFSSKHTLKIKWRDKANKLKELTKKKVKSKGTYFSTSKKRTNKDEAITITAKVGNKESSVTIEQTKKPLNPTIAVKRNNDYRFEITVKGNGKPTVPTTSLILQRQTDTDTTWEDIVTWSGTKYGSYNETYTDQTVERGHRYRYQVRSHNVNGYGKWQKTDWLYTAPPDISDVAHTRVDNNQNIVTWTKSGQELDRNLINGYKIYRSDSGATFKYIATVDRGVIEDGTGSYTDKTCEPNNFYRYAVRPMNPGGEGTIYYPNDEGTDPTYNTPAAPVKVEATKNANGTVLVKITNPAKTADVLQIARYEDDIWTQYDDIDQSESVITEYTDTRSIEGTVVRYRIRNGRNELAQSERYSDWTYSDVLVTLSQPDPPTLTEPYDNAVVAIDRGTIPLKWIHNPVDGTSQTQAQIYVYANGGTPLVLTTTESYRNLDISQYSPGDIITWKVRTKGQHADYSDFSETHTFRILSKPELHITSPANSATIENLPITLGFDYEDLSGTMSNLRLDILQNDEVVHTKQLDIGSGTTGSYEYELSDYLFDNGEAYLLRLTALSDTGLQAVDEIGIAIDYVPVILQNQYYVDTDVDEETGYVTVMITSGEFEPDPEPDPDIPQPVIVNSPVEKAYLYRIYDGERVLIKEVSEGEQLVDRFAPLNNEFTYELLEIAKNGNIALDSEICEVPSDYWYIYYGPNYEKVAKALWDPSGDVSMKRPEKQQVRYSGREYPVSYDSGANEEAYNFTTTIRDREELNHFREMMKKGGQGVWKSCDGFVYHADFDFSFSADYTMLETMWQAKLDVTRIEGEAL